MEARIRVLVLRIALTAGTLISFGALSRTENFLVSAPTPELAQSICQAAEKYRRDLAIQWLGHELPRWQSPCPITANVAPNLGAGGATSFIFERGAVFGWQMTIQGSAERILDSVLPHEVTHTIFATHFRQPLPRWADEGACTTVEHASEQGRHRQMLITFLQTGRGIAMSRLMAMKDYPPDVLPLYAQGYSVARYLIEQGGRRKFVSFVGDGLKDENWPRAMKKFYGDDTLAALQNRWLAWVRQGSPKLVPQPTVPEPAAPQQPAVLLASNTLRQRPSPNLLYHVGRDGSSQQPQAAPATSSAEPIDSAAPPLVPIVRPAPQHVAATNGWRASGARHDIPAGYSSPGNTPPPEPTPQPYQAIRQQPLQGPVETVLEP